MDTRFDTRMMSRALQLARRGQYSAMPNPHVGCVLVRDGRVIGEGFSCPAGGNHAEIEALRAAGDAVGATAYVTLEPCTMCAAAISFARIRRLYYGAADPKGGAVDSGVRFFSQPTCHHRPEIYGGIQEAKAAALLKDFFAARR